MEPSSSGTRTLQRGAPPPKGPRASRRGGPAPPAGGAAWFARRWAAPRAVGRASAVDAASLNRAAQQLRLAARRTAEPALRHRTTDFGGEQPRLELGRR